MLINNLAKCARIIELEQAPLMTSPPPGSKEKPEHRFEVDARTGERKYLYSKVDPVRLPPGVSRVEKERWEAAAKHEMTRVLLSGKGKDGRSLIKRDPYKTEPLLKIESDSDELPRDMGAAMRLIEMTTDVELLLKWKDERPEFAKQLDLQVLKIENPAIYAEQHEKEKQRARR